MAQALIQLKSNVADFSELELFSLELKAFGLSKPVAIDAYNALQILKNSGCVSPSGLNLLTKEAETAQEFPWGYLAEGDEQALQRLAKRSAFVFRIFNLGSGCRTGSQPGTVIPSEYGILELISTLAKKKANTTPPRLTYDDILAFVRLEAKDKIEEKLQGEYLALIKGRPEGPFSHDIHYYKAKFFPRLARSLINGILPGSTAGGYVLDPFVGSGTTLLESALLEYPSVGIDIDPLSILISQAKVLFLNLCPSDMEKLICAAERAAFCAAASTTSTTITELSASLPRWLLKNRKMTPESIQMLTSEIAFLRTFINEAPPYLKDFAKVFASDAITRRVKMRILGTGSGRFSLDFSKKTSLEILIDSLMEHKHIAEALSWARRSGILPANPYSVQANVGDARNLTYKEAVDAVLTSPPYLPASSGRESYAKHRALSLLTINGQTVADIDSLIRQSMGSTENLKGDITPQAYPIHDLSDTERSIISWLQEDPLRQSKAPAFTQYFRDVRRALAATHRALKPGHKAVFVVGKQSTFYEFSSKKPLLIVPLAEIFAASAERVGFTVEKAIDIKLAKRMPNARPRSLDDYFETALILRK